MTAAIDIDRIPEPDLRHEWQHFRGYGYTDTKIAERLGISERTIARWHRDDVAKSEERRTRVAELTAAGKSA
ncbi:MAG: helix-turn-helix domain-containing protein, partial [Gordonia sp. (in: high G+C Gram-positive bacteria)]